MLVQALQNGDIQLLKESMFDKIHQEYRLPIIPGAKEAISKVRQLGGAAAISGAGPSLIAFTKDEPSLIQTEMANAFEKAGYNTKVYHLEIEKTGAIIQ